MSAAFILFIAIIKLLSPRRLFVDQSFPTRFSVPELGFTIKTNHLPQDLQFQSKFSMKTNHLPQDLQFQNQVSREYLLCKNSDVEPMVIWKEKGTHNLLVRNTSPPT